MDIKELEKLNTPEINDRLEKLPVGYISKKLINGREYCYYQWREKDKVKSKYVKKNEIEQLIIEIDERTELKKILKARSLKERTDAYAETINTMQNRVAIGVQDFKKIITRKCFYIDKTRFIKEWWMHEDDITLINRPRRFGKTLNMSMLYYYFSNEQNEASIFENLDISKWSNMKKYQGQYPVIFVSFAGIRFDNIEKAYDALDFLFWDIFSHYNFIFESESVTEEEKAYYKSVCRRTDISHGTNALKFLSKILYRYYGKKVIILLDEYDTPIIEAFSSNCWNEMLGYTKSLFSNTFKNNNYLEKACLTGITRVSKETLFSDMNNIRVIGTTSEEYADIFGFTEEEVFSAMDAQGYEEKELVKEWYDGFTFGKESDMYNPWAISYYLETRETRDFWVNTSSNDLVADLFMKSSLSVKNDLNKFLEGKCIHKKFMEEVNFRDIYDDEGAMWSLLVASGYLKIENVKISGETECDLSITNKETMLMFRNMVKRWFKKGQNSLDSFAKALEDGDVDMMNYHLEDIIYYSASYFDTGRGETRHMENFYHGLVLGLISELRDRYYVRSNRESGLGRYDIMLERKEGKSAIFIEFKLYDKRKEKSIEETAKRALNQIDEKNYQAELISRGYSANDIKKFGIAFKGKEVLVI